MLWIIFIYTTKSYLGFSIIHHFESERPSLFGSCGFSGIPSSPYSVGVHPSLYLKNWRAIIICKYLSICECSSILALLGVFGKYNHKATSSIRTLPGKTFVGFSRYIHNYLYGIDLNQIFPYPICTHNTYHFTLLSQFLCLIFVRTSYYTIRKAS